LNYIIIFENVIVSTYSTYQIKYKQYNTRNVEKFPTNNIFK